MVGKLSQQSQISTVQRLKFLLRAENQLLRMGHEVSMAPARGILWKSHTQGAKELHVACELQFADHRFKGLTFPMQKTGIWLAAIGVVG